MWRHQNRSRITGLKSGSFDIEGSDDENVPPTFTRAGGVPERPKGPDCKSDGSAFVGSNPTPSTNQDCGLVRVSRTWRVLFSGRTSAFQADGAGSIPATRTSMRVVGHVAMSSRAHIAQAVEHFLGKEEVIGSNPIVSTIRLVDAHQVGAQRSVIARELPEGATRNS